MIQLTELSLVKAEKILNQLREGRDLHTVNSAKGSYLSSGNEDSYVAYGLAALLFKYERKHKTNENKTN